MAEYISFQPSDYFSTKIWTGTGASNAITGVGFQPDMVWAKSRSAAESHALCDAVRGATKIIYPNANNAEGTVAETLKTFDSDGYTIGTNSGWNTSAETYAAWNWKAGTTSGLTGGTITPNSYSFNTTSGCSIIEFDGNGSAGATVPHGLGVAPDMVIVKKSSSTAHWTIYHAGLGATKYLTFATVAAVAATNRWNDTAPTSTVFSLGTDTDVNGSGVTYMAYCFAGINGFSKFGTYVGNADNDGPFLYTGFKPSFVVTKRTDSTSDWVMKTAAVYDPPMNVNEKYLYANSDQAEVDSAAFAFFDFLSNGFKWRNSDAAINASAADYVYMAFAESPIVSSNDIPTVAR